MFSVLWHIYGRKYSAGTHTPEISWSCVYFTLVSKTDMVRLWRNHKGGLPEEMCKASCHSFSRALSGAVEVSCGSLNVPSCPSAYFFIVDVQRSMISGCGRNVEPSCTGRCDRSIVSKCAYAPSPICSSVLMCPAFLCLRSGENVGIQGTGWCSEGIVRE